MARYRKSTYVPLIFLVYMTGMFAILVPSNHDMSSLEKIITVAAGYLLVAAIWFFLRKKEKLQKEREMDMDRSNDTNQIEKI